MRFSLVDRILELQPNSSIRAVKNVSLAEEYLGDHFPRFPVLPGVFMLEALTQASAWLIRVSEDFAHSMVLLKEARNVKYANFLVPGEQLIAHCRIISHDERETKLKVEGGTENETKVSGRLVMERFNLADESPERRATDQIVRHQMRKMLAALYPSAR